MDDPWELVNCAEELIRSERRQKTALRIALSGLVRVLRERHYGRMPDEVQKAYDAAHEALEQTTP